MVTASRSEGTLTILLTGAGAPGTRGTIYALRQNPEGQPVRVVGVDAKLDNAGRYLVDAFHQVPHPEDRSYVDRLASICEKEAVRVVVPQTTRELPVLASHKGYLASIGVQTMVSNAPAIKTANNKWQLLQVFSELGLPVPAHALARSEEELQKAAVALGYPERPVVVKPPISNGMRGVRILKENAWDVHRFLTEKPSGLEITLVELIGILRRGDCWPELLVSEYLPGAEYTVDLFMGSKTRLAIPRERVSIRSGITFASSLDQREDLSEFSSRVAERVGLRYAIGFQFKLDANGIPKPLECNPRIQGTMVASVFSGANVIWLSVRELNGDVPTAVPPRNGAGVFYRFWGGISVGVGRVDEI